MFKSAKILFGIVIMYNILVNINVAFKAIGDCFLEKEFTTLLGIFIFLILFLWIGSIFLQGLLEDIIDKLEDIKDKSIFKAKNRCPHEILKCSLFNDHDCDNCRQ